MNDRLICEKGGCMSKLSGITLKSLINNVNDGYGISLIDTPEDCSVLELAGGTYLFTTDYGLLVGDDYSIAGEIAALNAISDVYAMGGVPVAALVMLSVTNKMDLKEKEALLGGLFKVCKEDKVEILGGHTIVSDEPMAGLSVIGIADPNNIILKKGACEGDLIWVTKRIGMGLVLRAYSNNLVERNAYQEAINEMLIPNKIPSEILCKNVIHAMTDLTGYGFLGHLSEMLDNHIGAEIYINKIPVLNSLYPLSPYTMNSDYIIANREYTYDNCIIQNIYGESIQELSLFDPQTNGGLIIVSDSSVDLAKYGYYNIGRITSNPVIMGVKNEAV